MLTKKRVITVLSIVAVLLTLSGVMAHPSSKTTLGAQEAPQIQPGDITHSAVIPMMVDNPYIIADIAEVASPATVFITVEWPVVESSDPWQRTMPQDPFSYFFNFWFNDPFSNRQPSQTTSAGSGFIIDPSGIVLTNQHVVGNQGENQTITIVIDAAGLEREYKAEIIGSDRALDLAVLRIVNENGDVFPTIPLGDSDATRVGEWTIAIGNPYGRAFEHTVTVGVLSAKGREISVYNSETGRPQTYRNLMQTDAAINQGNSGGPLLNIEGEVIGINTAVHAQAQGIGFAIPINVAKEVLDELITTGGVSKTWLGIYQREITTSLAEQLQLPDEKGVIVVDVVQGSPAEDAGLKAWDVIRRIGDSDIFNTEDVAKELAKYNPGDKVLVTVYRGGEMLMFTVTLGNMPSHLR
ncbi:MAG: trypsin-like serine protease [Firmicutes bacterium]|nr:trypsin-like serine protease [Bacillota bacterium]